ncbi:MAG: DUF1743 domain-containing protein [Candidatus Altiarchaeales archaeon]|nr:DUF1743 domain-containing protein [Candidatus Altiarchaeales archaeon]
MLIGIDDTDSVKGGCTTYLAALLCRKFEPLSFPKLIRLNPNIPFKTRGNGAVAVELEGDLDVVKKFTLRLVEKYSYLNDSKTNPGVVFVDKLAGKERDVLNDFYLKAVSQLVEIKEADELAGKVGAEVFKYKNGRGVIGALAAVGSRIVDKTYEFIAYRGEKARGPRKLDLNSVFEMNNRVYPKTFDNVDLETKQVLITPHGYDPLFCGIRGESPEVVEKAWKMLRPLEDISLMQIFESNQGTDVHLRVKKISEIRPYDCVVFEGVVSTKPKTISGGHVFFEVEDGSGVISCGAYEPTGGFRSVVRQLMVGDVVRCFGGVGRYPGTVNLEKLFVCGLARETVFVVPNCCSKKMTSAGRGKGYKCRKCGKRTREAKTTEIKRNLKAGWYEVPPRARRHLSKPLVRQI